MATKAGEFANAVLSAGIGFAARSDRLRAEVERFLAQGRVAKQFAVFATSAALAELALLR